MKNCLISLHFLMTILFLPGGCQKNYITEEKITFDTIHFNKLNYFSPHKSNNHCTHLIIDFVYPRQAIDSPTLKIMQSLFVEKIFGESFANLTPKQAVQEYAQRYFQEIKKTFNQIGYTGDETDNEYYLRLKSRIIYQGNHLLSFIIGTVSYEGGAHPSKNLHGYVFDLSTHRLLSENQFGNISYSKSISLFLVQEIMKKNKCIKERELENLGYNLSFIMPNNNFTVDTNGITYYFNEYEIGAYFLGLTQIFLPYEKINMYILENSPLSVFMKK